MEEFALTRKRLLISRSIFENPFLVNAIFPSKNQRLLDMVQVNCHAVVHLTRLYLPEMVARRRGNVLILASTASFQPFLTFRRMPPQKRLI